MERHRSSVSCDLVHAAVQAAVHAAIAVVDAVAVARFDPQGSGGLRMPALLSYLKTVFAIAFRIDSRLEANCGVSLGDLAASTADACFSQSGVTPDGVISLGAFTSW